MVNYSETEVDFYEQQKKSLNPLRVWFHTSRNDLTRKLVDDFYQQGSVIVDLGCGNVLWNEKLLPVIGVDVNEGFLNFSLNNKRLSQKVIAEIATTGLPENYADIVVITEVLEHVNDLKKQLNEIKRILKPGGVIISSVPYDTRLSMWKPLFAIQCFYRGRILGEQYYKEQCGHINHFSPKSISELFINNGFTVSEQGHNKFFTIFTIAKK